MPAQSASSGQSLVASLARFLTRFDRLSMFLLRLGVAVVLLWIGGLKWFKYEADGIVPFMANSPFFKWLLGDPANYKAHMNPEGVLNEANRSWHTANGTYSASIGIGVIICLLGLLILSHYLSPTLGMLGALALIGFSVVTLSFLVTTPEVWVSAPKEGLADADLGFPYLSGRGRLVVKDCIQMGAGFVLLVDSARTYLRRKQLAA
ncbi:MAG: YkgB family protein [Propionibacteriaceae bacterium]|nr:YkgB family protein [Propionibacteriaceae bacterium]